MKMWIRRPIYNFFSKNVNRIGCHPVYIFVWKCESGGPPSGLHFEKNCKLDTGHPVQYLFFKKNKRSFWSFLQGQFWHFQNLWRCRIRVLGCRKNSSTMQCSLNKLPHYNKIKLHIDLNKARDHKTHRLDVLNKSWISNHIFGKVGHPSTWVESSNSSVRDPSRWSILSCRSHPQWGTFGRSLAC